MIKIYILGISSWYHDSASCLIKDGKIISAVQEERFTRIKHDKRFPSNSIEYCIREAKIDPNELTSVVFYEKPMLKFNRLVETYLAYAPKGVKSFSIAMPLWIKDKLYQKNKIIKELNICLGDKVDWGKKLLFSEHHLSHSSSAFFPSPFKKAAILTLDGVGEWATTSIAIGNNNHINIEKEIHFPHSLGLLYSAFTYFTGFRVNSGEYKLMGLAPYGDPIYSSIIKDNLIDIKNDGSFRLNMDYFDYCTGFKMTNSKFNDLFKSSPRNPEAKITQKEMNLAASIQKITEEIILKLAYDIQKNYSEKNLCLAGGVALNCVANGLLHKEKVFDKIWIQPASGDAGGALGAALAAYYLAHKKERILSYNNDSMKGSYLGPSFTSKEVKISLKKLGAKFKLLNYNEMINLTVNELIKGKAIGWMQGRMEFGPRALGGRSIIADPRSSFMQKQLNLKVKYRESFRPFAPSILRENVGEWFEIEDNSPYMLLVSKILSKKQFKMSKKEEKLFGIKKLNIKRSEVPAVTHVDYSARIQTVHKNTNSIFHKLIKNFSNKTKCPILVNTSFNVRGEPIVCSPEDAFRCFMGTELDLLIIENFVLYKKEQNKQLAEDYKNKYVLD